MAASAAHDYRVHTSALAHAMTAATRRQRARSISRRSAAAVVVLPRQPPATLNKVAAPVLSVEAMESIRRNARAQQQDAHDTLLRALEMSTANEEMREHIQTMKVRIAARAARRHAAL
jgi:hypothetical protein